MVTDMTRRLTLSAAEEKAIRSAEPGDRIPIVREGVRWGTEHLEANAPPAEFMQACAPCETCHDPIAHMLMVGITGRYDPCPDCRIELVGPCLVCKGAGFLVNDDGYRTLCSCGGGRCISTIGHAYAAGKPMPIIHQRRFAGEHGPADFVMVWDSGKAQLWSAGDDEWLPRVDVTVAMAHYGDLAELDGKWLMWSGS